jgi:hypothetical protein
MRQRPIPRSVHRDLLPPECAISEKGAPGLAKNLLPSIPVSRPSVNSGAAGIQGRRI